MKGKNIYVSKVELEAIEDCIEIIKALESSADDEFAKIYGTTTKRLRNIISKATKMTKKDLYNYYKRKG
jgi:vacuolar-type H+-ATPase subunit H